FRGKNAVFPLTLGRAALCCRLRVSPFSKLKRSKNTFIFFGREPASALYSSRRLPSGKTPATQP
ncbi:hypothetical protein, partial [uncultured Desulfovibrio sp.]|uniref:hypothetical protein n=1 Tax=uncultured Desulfovibrio sp. TaxID=167968 RepID=UPI0026341F9E